MAHVRSQERQECVCMLGIIVVVFVGALSALWFVATHSLPA